jgi:iron complex transport system substrate-binding protein
LELRLLPLISSATEIVHALGLGRFQVGRSHECDYPPSVTALPVCTRPAIPVSGASGEIDRLVKQRLASALSVYEVDAELIRRLRPTHIITQTQCKVCAVSLDDVERALRGEIGIEAQIIAIEPYALSDVWADIRRVGSACGSNRAAGQLIATLQTRMDNLRQCATGATERPRVATLEWLDPLIACGTWVPELIELAGGENLFGAPGQHSPVMRWDELASADADIIVALPCGFDLQRTSAEMRALTSRLEWKHLRAVRTRQIFVCDGNRFMNRPGPRLVESLQAFAEMLHPALFPPRLEHVAWERYAGAA